MLRPRIDYAHSRFLQPMTGSMIERAAAQATAGNGIDVVFNNAGYGMSGPLEGLSDEQGSAWSTPT